LTLYTRGPYSRSDPREASAPRVILRITPRITNPRNDMSKPDTKSTKKPFFARFLETQELEQVQGGKATKKFPSDADEAQTMKYPSDGDDALPTE